MTVKVEREQLEQLDKTSLIELILAMQEQLAEQRELIQIWAAVESTSQLPEHVSLHPSGPDR